MVVVAGCGQVGRGPRGWATRSASPRPAGRFERQLELSTCPQPRAAAVSQSVRQT